jgi:hypothetical protein
MCFKGLADVGEKLPQHQLNFGDDANGGSGTAGGGGGSSGGGHGGGGSDRGGGKAPLRTPRGASSPAGPTPNRRVVDRGPLLMQSANAVVNEMQAEPIKVSTTTLLLPFGVLTCRLILHE